MQLVKTLIFSDSFNRADENPLDPALWTENGQAPYDHCLIQNKVCYAVNNPDLEGIESANATFLFNQYAEFDVAVIPASGNGGAGAIFRANDTGAGLYTEINATNGGSVLLEGELGFATIPAAPLPATPFHFFEGVIGNTFYYSINNGEVQTYDITHITSSTATVICIFLSPLATYTDTGVQNFAAGNLALLSAGGGGSSRLIQTGDGHIEITASSPSSWIGASHVGHSIIR